MLGAVTLVSVAIYIDQPARVEVEIPGPLGWLRGRQVERPPRIARGGREPEDKGLALVQVEGRHRGEFLGRDLGIAPLEVAGEGRRVSEVRWIVAAVLPVLLDGRGKLFDVDANGSPP